MRQAQPGLTGAEGTISDVHVEWERSKGCFSFRTLTLAMQKSCLYTKGGKSVNKVTFERKDR